MSESAVQQVAASLERFARLDSKLQCAISLLEAPARKRAADLDAAASRGESRGALHGVPVAVKDVFCTDEGTTTCGSKMLAGFKSPYNAHCVERLLDAGAVIVAKTNTDEFAMGSSTENSAYFPTRNPWDPDRVPGGSSGGSVAAVAARIVPYALGSDTGGSIRQPASFCGVCGLKPTYGRVSRYGLVAFASSLDHVAPCATSAEGLARVLGCIAGKDARDSTSVDQPVPDYAAELGKPLGSLRLGVPREYFGEGLDGEVRAAVEAAIEQYRKLGAAVADISLPHTKYTIACYYLICTAEASSNLARYDGVHFGHRTATGSDFIEMVAASRAEGFGPEVARRIMLGTYALSSGYYDAYYLKALKVRTLIARDFRAAFEKCDVIVSPTTPTAAFRLGEKCGDPLQMYLADIYTTAANLAGIPAASIPCGFTSDGLPIGLQLMAPAFAEARLLQVAHAYQQVTDYHTRVPPMCAA
ncbi:MAG: glutamyl-tRNA(Gln) amidotransferase subunit A [Phycisphaerae bacterium]|nr:MAG: Asp-tRNA(Asn)/Glu-tRNA(Gln) amidotransferase subunit GatA [Planctomycetia bacterium]RIK67002.1 MAG: Asp-tRNA(Asn)/Glu-tRNA(Gln) amidotransferase GatCAB subunit A [Planctomycetota bacterium]GJQ26011.1 MAG: glutamyl-tRNA(Gln) amidotransferase subunit A [Phycisphaerae bacterium]